MGATTSTVNNSNLPSNYHTVPICPNLRRIKKYYSIEKRRDLPPNDYWINTMKQVNKSRYKLQHMIANGPC